MREKKEMEMFRSRFKKTPFFLFLLLFFSRFVSVAIAAEYELNEGCSLKKYEEGEWTKADSSEIKGVAIEKLHPKGDRVRFKVDGIWFSTKEGCLAALDAPPPESEDEEEVELPRRRKKNTGKPSKQRLRSSFQAFGLVGGYRATGKDDRFQLAFGGGLKAQLGESLGFKAQFTRSSRSEVIKEDLGGNVFQSLKESLAVSEITLIPTLNVQALYFGPQFGMALLNYSVTEPESGESLSASTTALEFGANAGFSLQLGDHLSLGPDFHYTHILSSKIGTKALPSAHVFKLFLGVNFIF